MLYKGTFVVKAQVYAFCALAAGKSWRKIASRLVDGEIPRDTRWIEGFGEVWRKATKSVGVATLCLYIFVGCRFLMWRHGMTQSRRNTPDMIE